MNAGKFDRRITVQFATVTKDASGDPVRTWADVYKRWARKIEGGQSESEGASQVIRTASVAWILRADDQSRAIFPESHRFIWQDRIYEINGIRENGETDRGEAIRVETTTRPDGQGARGPIP